jgi:hypothetical protein
MNCGRKGMSDIRSLDFHLLAISFALRLPVLPFTLNHAFGWSTVWCMHVLFERWDEERYMILEMVCIFVDDE